ncbi:MAG: hypothetical protein QOE09_2857 [Ilumatobacteraceae bacterium]
MPCSWFVQCGYRDAVTLTETERAEMSDLFEKVGPDAPTLCEGWMTRDLLAHLLVRERRPDAAVGILVPFLGSHTKNVTDSVASEPWDTMIEQFREGPPFWSPWSIPVVGDRANLAEFFIHHEDIRRAGDDWAPRDDNPERDDALWKPLKMMGRLLFRKSPVGVTLRSAGREDIVAKKGDRGVILVGLPGEIVIHAFGRPLDRVRVVVQGDPKDIEAFEASPRGL